jgi:WD40 repeat protein
MNDVQSGLDVGVMSSYTVVPEEQVLFTASYNNTVKKWNVQTGLEVKTLEGAHRLHRLHGLRPRGAGTLHGFQRQQGEEVECEDGLRVKKWHVKTGFKVKTLDGHTDSIACMRGTPIP